MNQPIQLLHPRQVERLVQGQATSDGAGVKLTRVLTSELQVRLDPFLMLDAFGSNDPKDYGAGFPNHPHRGFETITYMIAGRMRHKDSGGNEGLLQNGGMQWMTAGRGLVHSEMPEQEEGVMEGFQLWLNLPGRDKLCTPWYRDVQAPDIPFFTLPADPGADGVSSAEVQVRLLAGELAGHSGAVTRDAAAFPTQVIYADLSLPAGASISLAVPAGHNAFLYVYREAVQVAGTTVPQRHMAILRQDAASDGVTLMAPVGNQADARVLLIAGQPLGEPIAQYGPFVMNTRQELMQAVEDFQSGRMG